MTDLGPDRPDIPRTSRRDAIPMTVQLEQDAETATCSLEAAAELVRKWAARYLAREITAPEVRWEKPALTFLFPPDDCLGPVGELHRLLYDRGISFTVSMD